MYLYRDYFKANVYTVWVHGPLGLYTPWDFREVAVSGLGDFGAGGF